MKEKILVSACLLGVPCRYDGKSKPVKEIQNLESTFTLIPFCPEVEGGLSTPRLPCELQNSKVIRKDGVDLTKEYTLGAEKALALCKKMGCKIAILKEKSPSCGSRLIYDGTFSGTPKKGQGITAKLLSENDIKVYSEEDYKNKTLG